MDTEYDSVTRDRTPQRKERSVRDSRKVRTLAITLPYNEDGDFVYASLQASKEMDERSMSKIAFRIIREYFNAKSVDDPEWCDLMNSKLIKMNDDVVL